MPLISYALVGMCPGMTQLEELAPPTWTGGTGATGATGGNGIVCGASR